jgi:hypothetical protein
MAVKLADGEFLHFVEDSDKVILGLSAFETFRRDIRRRCAELRERLNAEVIGNYRMLSE